MDPVLATENGAGMAAKAPKQRQRMTRSVIAARTGVNIETVRDYERIGLLPAPPRSEGGHRIYDEDMLRRLNLIRRCRELGFTLNEVRGLLLLVDGGDYTCGEGFVKLTDYRLFSAFLHEAKPLKLHIAAISDLPIFRSESG